MTVITGRPFHVVGAGCSVGKRGGRLVAFKEGLPRTSAPLTMISEVLVSGRVQVSTAAMHALLAHDIPLVLLTENGRPLGRLEPPSGAHVDARRAQLALHTDPAARLAMARAAIVGKIRNQHVLLRRRARRAPDPDAVWEAARRLSILESRATTCESIPAVMGMEGGAAGIYYRAIRTFVDPTLGCTRRDRQGRDVVNALTNYCSALLRETVVSGILAAGLDPFVSFLHEPARGRPTLAFDLMEEWRPVLLDATVLALIGLKSVTTSDLEDGGAGRPLLSPDARARIVERFHARLAAPARGWPEPPSRRTYRDQVRAQCTALRTWILSRSDEYEPFVWR
ncbi:CRISPR-associated endonuclease Cas1 [Actinomadura sp. CNU-125]|uniref:CRISPR-associated endonuclease Cas1 n=1 Tax=Actinomadura sp. CNU-125 TaxID=1904961 RepID=UPI000961F9B5|nr:CRISPR-associated endonuclease Cas1 [Actinomadura sp. CNU-125]OLT23340.1 CRISPR-associated endonuclease Cas1 [Actinomadura sp. CNU-125]